MDGTYLFSIVILMREGRHRLPLTLDTLKEQAEKNFEVILIDPKADGRLGEAISQYPEMEIRAVGTAAATVSEMMNEGVGAARGRYLQFLEPGDRYISRQGLAYVKELIEESGSPELAYSGFLMRPPGEPPHAMTLHLNLNILQKGMLPTESRSSWISKGAAIALGGFDRTLNFRSAFDLLCRLFLKEGMRAVYSRRVITDCEPQKKTPKEAFGYAGETWKILFRHFGLWHALRWVFVQDHLRMIRWSARRVKEAFWHTNR